MECRICRNTIDNIFHEIPEMMFGSLDKFSYFQCSSCGCLQIANIPENISKYYPPHYYSFSSTKGVKSISLKVKIMRDAYAIDNNGILGWLLYKIFPNKYMRSLFYNIQGKNMRSILSNIHTMKKARIMDVGCGSGRLLCAFSRAGFDNLLGVDPYIREDIIYNDNLKIINSFIYEVTGKWDLIMFNHSFEHISDPIETIKKVAELLSSGGVCLLRIPTVSSFAWEYYREKWVQLDAPRHFFLHSIESIKKLAEKVDLNLERIVYESGPFQFWGSELYKKGIPLKSDQTRRGYFLNSHFSKGEMKRFEQEAQKLNSENRGDQAAFFLRKE